MTQQTQDAAHTVVLNNGITQAGISGLSEGLPVTIRLDKAGRFAISSAEVSGGARHIFEWAINTIRVDPVPTVHNQAGTYTGGVSGKG